MPFVSISLTSISRRLGTLHQTIGSLIAQDYPDFDVNLYLSSDPHMLDEGVTRLPEELDELLSGAGSRLKIYFTSNTGPYRKLLPLLAKNRGSSTLIATADDDTIYPPDWLARLVERYNTHRCIIAYRGHEMLHRQGSFTPYRRWMTTKSKQQSGLLLLPTGKDGVLYHSRFFHPAVMNIQAAAELAPTTDDLWWKWHSAAVGVPVHVINPDYTTDTLPEVDWQGSLYDTYNKAGENDRVIKRLDDYGSKKLGFSFFEAA